MVIRATWLMTSWFGKGLILIWVKIMLESFFIYFYATLLTKNEVVAIANYYCYYPPLYFFHCGKNVVEH